MENKTPKQNMRCDIIIPVWNQLEFTRDCIQSLIGNTAYSYRLIIIDNASDAQTKEYLQGLSGKKGLDLTLIRNERNLGFIKAANQGMQAATAPYLCLLNNDTLVTPGWLKEMVGIAQQREDIGIVNPSSNTLGRRQKRQETLVQIAQRSQRYCGKYAELSLATGFCMLIKRVVIEKVGPFDEIFGMGNFEDADFSKRAQQQGFICVCALGAYVYHRERRSFIKIKRFNQHFEHNRRIFHQRWGQPQRLLFILTKQAQPYLAKLEQEIVQLARQGNIIWIFLKGARIKQFPRHSNIYQYSLPERFFNLNSTWRLLKRKKKFDKIFIDDPGTQKKLKMLKPFHKAEVIYER